MNNEENRRIVENGLAQKKILRLAAEKEAQLERYEQDMIDTCNLHCADAKLKWQQEENKKREKEQRAMQRSAAAKARAEKVRLEYKAVNAVRLYAMLCLVVLLISAVTQLPFAVAVAMILGGAVFPASYIFRLYYPLEENK